VVDPIVFRSDDRETVVGIGDQVYLPSSLHSAIINYLLSDIFQTNGYLQSRKVYADIRILSPDFLSFIVIHPYCEDRPVETFHLEVLISLGRVLLSEIQDCQDKSQS